MALSTDAEADRTVPQRPAIPANWVTALIAVALIATSYTTGTGMYTIFGVLAIAIVMTLLVETVLVATSWLLGRDIARVATGSMAAAGAGRGWTGNLMRYAVLVSTFSLVFFICWFFSFNFYYSAMYAGGEDQVEAEAQPQQVQDLIRAPARPNHPSPAASGQRPRLGNSGNCVVEHRLSRPRPRRCPTPWQFGAGRTARPPRTARLAAHQSHRRLSLGR